MNYQHVFRLLSYLRSTALKFTVVLQHHYWSIAAVSIITYSIYLNYPFNYKSSIPHISLHSLNIEPQKVEKSPEEIRRENIKKQAEEFKTMLLKLNTDDKYKTVVNLPRTLLLDLAISDNLVGKDERSLYSIISERESKDPDIYQQQRFDNSDFFKFLKLVQDLNPGLTHDDILARLYNSLQSKIDTVIYIQIINSQPDLQSKARISQRIDFFLRSLKGENALGIGGIYHKQRSSDIK